ncbi:hypothetical protein [Streptomyces sp. YU58]|uniref:hypothetical protein n=1 Tax=Streptomyces sp. SX92 TaxID=3158972 RepID=UPI0027BA5338|nr:hypothetical protein [Streptomyces coralus]
MAAASECDGPPLTASALIAADEAWEDEGGAAAVFSAVPRRAGSDGRGGRLVVGM